MRFFLAALIAAATLVAAQLRIETPTNLVVCQPALLSWTGGTGPYFIAVIPGGQPSAAALKDFGQQTGTSLTWNVDLAAGTRVSLRITDSTGAVNYAEAVEIRAGSNTNCVNASGSGNVSAGGASATSAGGASGAATTPSGTPAPSGSSPATTPRSTTQTSSTAPASGNASASRSANANASASPTNAAGALKVQTAGVFGIVAGIFGAFAL